MIALLGTPMQCIAPAPFCCFCPLQVYSPLELLLFIAGCCTIADSFVPQLINVPKATVTHVVRAVLSVSFVVGASVVVYNLKSRFCKEQAWQVRPLLSVCSCVWCPFAAWCTTGIVARSKRGRQGSLSYCYCIALSSMRWVLDSV
jgi:hypothetical protein